VAIASNVSEVLSQSMGSKLSRPAMAARMSKSYDRRLTGRRLVVWVSTESVLDLDSEPCEVHASNQSTPRRLRPPKFREGSPDIQNFMPLDDVNLPIARCQGTGTGEVDRIERRMVPGGSS
jgi:hypothetical protein